MLLSEVRLGLFTLLPNLPIDSNLLFDTGTRDSRTVAGWVSTHQNHIEKYYQINYICKIIP